jgi:hypothetical protein
LRRGVVKKAAPRFFERKKAARKHAKASSGLLGLAAAATDNFIDKFLDEVYASTVIT